jgi:D-alanyl-D-alanine carboxypeptidase
MRDQLQALVDRAVVAFPSVPGQLLLVCSADDDIEVAAGAADRATGEPMTPGRRFRIASVTKPFVAAATLRLVEDSRIDLDAPIDGLVSNETVDTLRAGGYKPDAITTRHLLTHTSGVFDFAADAYGPPTDDGFVAACRADPGHRWTRQEQLQWAIDHGEPYGEPGSVFCYSDTGANIVGEILERTTGDTMGGAIRALVDYERLGLRHTYHESVEPEPPDLPPIAHQYEGDFDVWRYDPSVDLWGGGGLVSTCADIATFFRALLQGAVFREPSTLETMLRLPGVRAIDAGSMKEAANTGMFLLRKRTDDLVWWGHGGYWGTTVFTCPSLDLTVVSQDGQSEMPEEYKKSDVVRQVLAIRDVAGS